MFNLLKRKKETSSVAQIEKEEGSWLARMTAGLKNSSNKISSGINNLIHKRKLDQELLNELEELLISADLGVKTAAFLVQELAKHKFDKDITAEEVKETLASIISGILQGKTDPLQPRNVEGGCKVILVAGVNGNGKTTTIGKLAKQFTEQGCKTMLAACDTFRAAAIEQLVIWGGRSDATVITGKENDDAASVAYNALTQAKSDNYDVLLIDTAGRLHNKTNLMEELVKIIRVIKKIDNNAPHEVVLVLDATTGQNAFSQVNAFKEMVNITGLIVTKLDGTAKGGVVVGLVKEYNLPIHAIGVGEKVADLHPFVAEDFAHALLGVDVM